MVGAATRPDRLAGGNAAIALFANSAASAGGLLALILAFGATSGAHFNPVVTLSEAWQGGMKWSEALPYAAVQFLGAFAGVAAAHAMFGDPVFSAATQARTGAAQSSRTSCFRKCPNTPPMAGLSPRSPPAPTLKCSTM